MSLRTQERPEIVVLYLQGGAPLSKGPFSHSLILTSHIRQVGTADQGADRYQRHLELQILDLCLPPVVFAR